MSETGPIDFSEFDEWIDCWVCGGEGVLDDECTCQSVVDTCCCLAPTPPVCRECGGNGGWPKEEAV